MTIRNDSSNIRNNSPDIDQVRPAVKSISRAASILLCLSNGLSTVTEIANHSKLSKSTVHRLLKALEETFIVSQNPINHHYYLGPLITTFSLKPLNIHEYLILSSVAEMKRLSDIAEETITLAVMTGIQYIHLHEIVSKHDLRVIEEGRKIRPFFIGATTKVLLSQLNDEELRITIKNISIYPITENTVTDSDIMLAQVKEARRQGYSVSRGEVVAGALCISAPIKDYIIPAALSIVGPESRLQSKVTGITEEIQTSARRITENIAGIFKDGQVAPRSTGER